MLELIQEYWQPLIFSDGIRLTGVAMTLWLLVSSLILGGILAIPLALARVSDNPTFRLPVRLYTYVFCGTPLYIQLLVCYSGIYSLSFIREDYLLSSFFRSGLNCAILAFTLNTAAYTTEILAGAIKNIPEGETEAAKAYGLTGWRLYCFAILPSAFRRALPYYSNEVILLLHATTIAFAATVPELMKITRDINGQTYMTFHAFGIAAFLYALMSFSIVYMFRRAERKWLEFLGKNS